MGLRKSGVAKGRIAALASVAVLHHCKSAASTKTTTSDAAGIVRYYIGARSGEKRTTTGESSIALIRDYLGQSARRGSAAPAKIRHSLCIWAAAIEIDWQLDHALVCATATVESNATPIQAPSMSVETVGFLEGCAVNKEIPLPCGNSRPVYPSCHTPVYEPLKFSDLGRAK